MRGFRASRAAQQLHPSSYRGNGYAHPQSYTGQGPSQNNAPTASRTALPLPDWLKTPETKAAEHQTQKPAKRASLRLAVDNENPKRKTSTAHTSKNTIKKAGHRKKAKAA